MLSEKQRTEFDRIRDMRINCHTKMRKSKSGQKCNHDFSLHGTLQLRLWWWKSTYCVVIAGLLWRAPELLRDPDSLPRGSQKGDVYSFAFIVYEIHARHGPWGDTSLTPKGTVSRPISFLLYTNTHFPCSRTVGAVVQHAYLPPPKLAILSLMRSSRLIAVRPWS